MPKFAARLQVCATRVLRQYKAPKQARLLHNVTLSMSDGHVESFSESRTCSFNTLQAASGTLPHSVLSGWSHSKVTVHYRVYRPVESYSTATSGESGAGANVSMMAVDILPPRLRWLSASIFAISFIFFLYRRAFEALKLRWKGWN